MQAYVAPEKCIWCNSRLDRSNSLEMSYNCCSNCLYPLPTE